MWCNDCSHQTKGRQEHKAVLSCTVTSREMNILITKLKNKHTSVLPFLLKMQKMCPIFHIIPVCVYSSTIDVELLRMLHCLKLNLLYLSLKSSLPTSHFLNVIMFSLPSQWFPKTSLMAWWLLKKTQKLFQLPFFHQNVLASESGITAPGPLVWGDNYPQPVLGTFGFKLRGSLPTEMWENMIRPGGMGVSLILLYEWPPFCLGRGASSSSVHNSYTAQEPSSFYLGCCRIKTRKIVFPPVQQTRILLALVACCNAWIALKQKIGWKFSDHRYSKNIPSNFWFCIWLNDLIFLITFLKVWNFHMSY